MGRIRKTEGVLGRIKTILQLFFPLVAAELTISLNGFTDSLFLSRLSESSLRAALPANMIASCILIPMTAALSYSGTLVAQACGAGRPARALASFVQALWMAFVSLPVFFAAIPIAHAMLALFRHAPDIFVQERALSAIQLAGSPLTLVSAVLAGFFAGQKRTRLVGAVTIAGALAKIGLTPLLVFGYGILPGQGIVGAGLSAVFAGGLTTLAYLVALLKDPLARRATRHPRLLLFRRNLATLILRQGWPILSAGIIGTLAFMCTVALIARLDALSAAASSAVFAINCPFNAIMAGLHRGHIILMGRQAGGGRTDEITQTIRAACCLGALLSLAYIVFLAIFAHDLLALFLSADTPFDTASFLARGTRIIAILAARIPIEFGGLVIMAALLGTGYTRAVFDSSLRISAGVWLPSLALVAWLCPTAEAYWLTILANTLFRALLNRHYYRSRHKKPRLR